MLVFCCPSLPSLQVVTKKLNKKLYIYIYIYIYIFVCLFVILASTCFNQFAPVNEILAIMCINEMCKSQCLLNNVCLISKVNTPFKLMKAGKC